MILIREENQVRRDIFFWNGLSKIVNEEEERK